MDQTAVRKLGEEIILYEEGEYYSAAVYEIHDAISIQLVSEQVDDVEPIRLDWSIIDFDGQVANL